MTYHFTKWIPVPESPYIVPSENTVPMVESNCIIFQNILKKEGYDFEILSFEQLEERIDKEQDRSKHFYVYFFVIKGEMQTLLTELNVISLFEKPKSRVSLHYNLTLKKIDNYLKTDKTDAIQLTMNKEDLEETWKKFNNRVDLWDGVGILHKMKLLRIFNIMEDFFEFMLIWNTKKPMDTFIKYFLRNKKINDYNRAFLIVEPVILNNIVQYITTQIRNDPLNNDLGYTVEVTDKDTWKSVQMIVYLYSFDQTNPDEVVVGYPLELQVITPQVLAYEYFQKTHALYEIQRLPFNTESFPIWKFLHGKGIENVEVSKWVEQKLSEFK